MANTYTQLYIQFVFAVKGRKSMIPKAHKAQLHKYITGLVQNRGHKMLRVHCMPDHCHIFVGMKPVQSISKLVEEIKTGSSKFIKKQPWMPFPFAWQKGFGAFSYSHSHIDRVVKYIMNQEQRHQKQNFEVEYLALLKQFDVEFDEQYLFQWNDMTH